MAILDLQPTTDGAGGYAAPGESGDIAAGGAVVGIHGAEVSETLSANTNDWDLGDDADALTWLVDFAGHTLTGILAPEVTGEVHILKAVTAGTIAHQGTGSGAANRISCPGLSDISLAAGDAIVIEYLATTSRWQVIGGTGGGTGVGGPAGSAGGDLSGTYPDPTVVGLLGTAIQPWSAALSFPPTEAQFEALLGPPSSTGGLTFMVKDTTTGYFWTVQSFGTKYLADTLVELPAGSGGGAVIRDLSSAPEGGWTFQGNPMVLVDGAYTYIGYIDSSGNVKVAVARAGAIVATRTLHAALEVDDHDNQTMYVRPDGKLHCFYSKHIGPDIYERISTNTLASDPTLSGGFAAEASLSATFAASQSTYPSALYLSNVDGAGDSVFVFWREVAGANQQWWYAGNDFSSGWAGPTHLHSLTYSKIESDGVGRIDVACSDHPVDGATKIGHLYRQSAHWHKSDGTNITASMPLAITDMTTVYTASGTDRVWILDEAKKGSGDPVILFARYPSNDTSDIRVMYADCVAGVWTVHEICATGGYIPDTTVGGNPLEVYYLGGAGLSRIDPTRVLISREISGQWEMFLYTTADAGATWTATQLTSGSTAKQIRPVGVLDASADFEFVWDEGTYHSYVNYSLGMRALAI